MRAKASKALQNFGSAALPQLTNMMTAFITNATFAIPGSYVVRLAAVDTSILNSNIWMKYNLGYFDFKTYTNIIGAVCTNLTVVGAE